MEEQTSVTTTIRKSASDVDCVLQLWSLPYCVLPPTMHLLPLHTHLITRPMRRGRFSLYVWNPSPVIIHFATRMVWQSIRIELSTRIVYSTCYSPYSWNVVGKWIMSQRNNYPQTDVGRGLERTHGQTARSRTIVVVVDVNSHAGGHCTNATATDAAA